MNENHGVPAPPPEVEQVVVFCGTGSYHLDGYSSPGDVNMKLKQGWTVHSVTPLPLIGEGNSHHRVSAAVIVLQRRKDTIIPESLFSDGVVEELDVS